MDKKDILLIYLLKDFCKNHNIEDKYEIILNKLDRENILSLNSIKSLQLEDNQLIEYIPKNDLIIKEKEYSKDKKNIIFYENIGSGSFGNVFKSFHKIDKNDYAMKIVPIYTDMKKEKYIKEVETISKLNHPNVIRYYNSWIETILPLDLGKLILDGGDSLSEYSSDSIIEKYEISEYLFIQMELCDSNLSDYFLKRNSINFIDSIKIFKDILNGLNYLHNMNIIHRDIKPSNIMFSNKMAKVGDFGMSIKLEKGEELVKSDNDYGTYNYLAPEVIDKKEYSFYSDIYSLGIILFELLNHFETQMERQKSLDLLKQNIFDDTFTSSYIKEKEYIKLLLNSNKLNRPLTGLILEKMVY